MNIVGFLKNSLIDYPKHISCVVFAPGCNMNCWYCHNREIITMQEGTISEKEVFSFLKNRVGLIDAVVISGGEPTMQKNLVQFAKKIKDLNFKVKLDTNGTNLKMIKELVEANLLNYIAMDIKAPLNNYNKITIVPDINEVKASINYIKTCGVDYEFRTTFAPNLTNQDIVEILKEIKGAKNYSLQAYIKPSYITNERLAHHTAEDFYKLKEIGSEYVGNFYVKNL